MTIDDKIAAFRADLPRMDSKDIIQKYIHVGASMKLDDGLYAELRREVATHFQVHPNSVVMVGSAKLGFSIKPAKRYVIFGDESDIDLAIVATDLYVDFWSDVHAYKESGELWASYHEFRNYHFHGWIRPDKLPPAERFARRADWWEFLRTVTAEGKYGPYKIRAGLYHSWPFLDSYQSICINQCKADA